MFHFQAEVKSSKNKKLGPEIINNQQIKMIFDNNAEFRKRALHFLREGVSHYQKKGYKEAVANFSYGLDALLRIDPPHTAAEAILVLFGNFLPEKFKSPIKLLNLFVRNNLKNADKFYSPEKFYLASESSLFQLPPEESPSFDSNNIQQKLSYIENLIEKFRFEQAQDKLIALIESVEFMLEAAETHASLYIINAKAYALLADLQRNIGDDQSFALHRIRENVDKIETKHQQEFHSLIKNTTPELVTRDKISSDKILEEAEKFIEDLCSRSSKLNNEERYKVAENLLKQMSASKVSNSHKLVTECRKAYLNFGFNDLHARRIKYFNTLERDADELRNILKELSLLNQQLILFLQHYFEKDDKYKLSFLARYHEEMGVIFSGTANYTKAKYFLNIAANHYRKYLGLDHDDEFTKRRLKEITRIQKELEIDKTVQDSLYVKACVTLKSIIKFQCFAIELMLKSSNVATAKLSIFILSLTINRFKEHLLKRPNNFLLSPYENYFSMMNNLCLKIAEKNHQINMNLFSEIDVAWVKILLNQNYANTIKFLTEVAATEDLSDNRALQVATLLVENNPEKIINYLEIIEKNISVQHQDGYQYAQAKLLLLKHLLAYYSKQMEKDPYDPVLYSKKLTCLQFIYKEEPWNYDVFVELEKFYETDEVSEIETDKSLDHLLRPNLSREWAEEVVLIKSNSSASKASFHELWFESKTTAPIQEVNEDTLSFWLGPLSYLQNNFFARYYGSYLFWGKSFDPAELHAIPISAPAKPDKKCDYRFCVKDEVTVEIPKSVLNQNLNSILKLQWQYLFENNQLLPDNCDQDFQEIINLGATGNGLLKELYNPVKELQNKVQLLLDGIFINKHKLALQPSSVLIQAYNPKTQQVELKKDFKFKKRQAPIIFSSKPCNFHEVVYYPDKLGTAHFKQLDPDTALISVQDGFCLLPNKYHMHMEKFNHLSSRLNLNFIYLAKILITKNEDHFSLEFSFTVDFDLSNYFDLFEHEMVSTDENRFSAYKKFCLMVENYFKCYKQELTSPLLVKQIAVSSISDISFFNPSTPKPILKTKTAEHKKTTKRCTFFLPVKVLEFEINTPPANTKAQPDSETQQYLKVDNLNGINYQASTISTGH